MRRTDAIFSRTAARRVRPGLGAGNEPLGSAPAGAGGCEPRIGADLGAHQSRAQVQGPGRIAAIQGGEDASEVAK